VGLTSQVHDFNPGIQPSGLFWTAPIDRGSVRVDLGEGSASLHVADLDVEDYGNVVNALKDGPSVPASVNIDISWKNGGGGDGDDDDNNDGPIRIRNADVGFAGEYVRNTATLVWSASESGFRFRSDPLVSGFAEIGHERNGVFFRSQERGDG
jgi:hypothetical protein